MGSGVDFHPEARVDIDEIADFIARDGSIYAARQVVRRILDAIDALVPFPHQGHHRTDLTSRPLRFWRVYDYLIAYAPDERPLWVMAVMHGHRSPRLLAAILRSREADPTTFGGKSASAQSPLKQSALWLNCLNHFAVSMWNSAGIPLPVAPLICDSVPS